MGWSDLSLKDWLREAILFCRGEGKTTKEILASVWRIADIKDLRDSTVPQTFHHPTLQRPKGELTVLSNVNRLLDDLRLHGEVKRDKEKVSKFSGLERYIWYQDDFEKLDGWFLYHRSAYGVRNPVWEEVRKNKEAFLFSRGLE